MRFSNPELLPSALRTTSTIWLCAKGSARYPYITVAILFNLSRSRQLNSLILVAITASFSLPPMAKYSHVYRLRLHLSVTCLEVVECLAEPACRCRASPRDDG